MCEESILEVIHVWTGDLRMSSEAEFILIACLAMTLFSVTVCYMV